MKKLDIIVAGVIFGLFFLINTSTLNDGHNWGDDFAQYIHHSINLVEHKPYTSDISLDYWVVYPPGFPLLLSSVIYWFGINFKILKFLNVLLWALSALAVYALALKRLNLTWARMLTAWFLTSSFFFFFKQNVLSDIPFMCFVLLSIWTLMESEEYQQKEAHDSSRIYLFLSIICMSYALLIRWAGVSLLLAAVVYFFVVKRDWKRPLGFILGACASYFIAFQCGSLFTGYFYKTALSQQQWYWAVWNNINYNFEMMASFFVPVDKFSSKWDLLIPFGLVNIALSFLLLGIIGRFIYLLFQRRISFTECFTFFYLIGAFLWPVRSGTRYFLPILIPITIDMIKWIKPAFHRIVLCVFVLLILQDVFIIGSNFKFNDDDIYRQESLEMIQWVGVHVRPAERYMFAKPRALGLLTHRMGASFWTHPEEMRVWYKRIKPLHINYLISDKHFDYISQFNDFRIPIDNGELSIKAVWENSRYKIFEVL